MITLAYSLAIFACVVGLGRCFVQSPQAKAADYLLISSQTQLNNPALAASAAWEAARLNPGSPEAWNMLASTLQQKGDAAASRQAHMMAVRLQKDPSDIQPLYAMPAELRLSFLAASDKDL